MRTEFGICQRLESCGQLKKFFKGGRPRLEARWNEIEQYFPDKGQLRQSNDLLPKVNGIKLS